MVLALLWMFARTATPTRKLDASQWKSTRKSLFLSMVEWLAMSTFNEKSRMAVQSLATLTPSKITLSSCALFFHACMLFVICCLFDIVGQLHSHLQRRCEYVQRDLNWRGLQ